MIEKVGRPADPRRADVMRRFRLHIVHPERFLPRRFLVQLSNCKSDEARRLLLGVSRKTT